jgi:predicted Zn-dependent protease
VHRYEELEKEYYKKRYLKIALFVVFVLLIIGGGFYFVNLKGTKPLKSVKKEKPKKVVKEKKVEKKVEKNETKKVEVKKIEVKKTIKEKTKKPSEVIDFMLPKVPANIKEVNETKKIKPNKPKKIEKLEKPKIIVKKTKPLIEEKTLSVKEMIAKFHANPTYDLAMMIANEFYNKNDLKNAKIWAIKANSLNPEDVKSWILFSNILLKKKEKQKAVEILKIYIQTYGNNPLIENQIRSINE